MPVVIKGIKLILNIAVSLILLAFIFIEFSPANITDSSGNNADKSNFTSMISYSLNDNDVIYDSKANSNNENTNTITPAREEVIKRAQDMVDVKWIPKYNLVDKNSLYVFKKGQTYKGIPYSMGSYQAMSANDFLLKINKSKTLYGNDCSGFVSAAWGISRQTTLSLYNAVKENNKVDGIRVEQISWEELKPGDALLLDNGKGKGHIMLFSNFDAANKDKIYVYEQNIATIVPFEPIPVARKDARSKEKLQKEGYMPIRLGEIE